ncbi:MAG: hypothetical protein J7480_09735 [Microbacteriaceae bacterium]|nr:hypothetical protein [Microbacteriaceae bacterium]
MNDWPPEMRIHVEERDRNLLELLFVRSAWGLLPQEPALEPRPDPGSSARPDAPDRATWEDWWREAWKLAWEAHISAPPGALAHLDHRSTSWIAQFGDEGIDTEALARWVDQLMPDLAMPLASQPEWRNAGVLRGAWATGLDTIIVLPYREPYAERVSARHLAVSPPVRNDPARYAEALRLRAT